MSAHRRTWVPEPPTDQQLVSWGLDPTWSRLLDVAGRDGSVHRWHVLDTGPTVRRRPGEPSPGERADRAEATVVCVHGNPTWGYAWATFLRRFGHRCRVIAVDQLGMGFSQRTGQRRFGDRVRDLDDVIAALDIDADVPLVLAAHDWGGAIAMGWAVDHVDRIDGMVLCNTGIAVPAGRRSPSLIRLAASRPLREFVCRRTPTFVEGTVRLSGSRIDAADRDAFRAPYRSAAARAAIADFVGDIPLRPGGGHPTDAPLAAVAERLSTVTAPVLLAWGARDPVFDDDFADDLADRLPNSTLQRFPSAGHLVMAEADVAGVVDVWLRDLAADAGRAPPGSLDDPARPVVSVAPAPLWSELDARRDDTAIAFVDAGAPARTDGAEAATWGELAGRVDAVAAELHRRGLRPGDRVAMLVPPGVDMVAAVYGVWRAGGVTVVADRGLGLRGLGAAVRGARPAWVIGPTRARWAASVLRWAPRAVAVDVEELVGADAGPLPAEPGGDDPAAILFTSGATGPAKGVRYLHGQLGAQRDALAAAYSITSDDRLVAAFAPFALYGPALGVPTALPDCDVTRPGELTADALEEACRRIEATMAFASPAALANVVATAGTTGHTALAGLRIVFSAGAPVPIETLRAVASLAPDAALHTPYGMTEALPVADIDVQAIEAALVDDPIGGVCVGVPVDGARVRIVPLGFDARADPADVPLGETGEILVAAAWVSDGYVGLWATERAARPPSPTGVWHRSGDVGHLDAAGRLWVEGRSVHVISAPDGPLTPVPVERSVEGALGVARAAAVGVGPEGAQQLVVVVEHADLPAGLASSATASSVRSAVGPPVAAVLTVPAIPVDIRHNAKVDRTAVGRWAAGLLAGRPAGKIR